MWRVVVSVVGVMLMCGCYSSVPSYRINSGIDAADLASIDVAVMPISSIKIVGFEASDSVMFLDGRSGDISDRFQEVLEERLVGYSNKRILRPKCSSESVMPYVKKFDAVQGGYFLNGVHHVVFLDDIRDMDTVAVPDGALREVDSFLVEIVDSSVYMNSSCGPDYAITFGGVSFAVVDTNGNASGIDERRQVGRQIIADGSYVIWDYRRGRYVAKGRLGPYRSASLSSVAKFWSKVIWVGNGWWLK